MRRLSLSVERPDLLAEWSPKNEITPDKVTCGSHIKSIWCCDKGHEWAATIKNRVNGSKCPYCEHRAVLKGYNDLKSRFPQIAKEWSDKNLPKKPSEVSAFSNSKFWWRCSNGHEWQARVADRSEGHGCPYCAGHLIWPSYNDLLTLYPDIAAEWSEKNGSLAPNTVSPKSTRKAWWCCNTCGFEFQTDIRARVKGVRCPSCRAMEIIKQRDIRSQERSIAKMFEQELPQLSIIYYSGKLGYSPETESDSFLGLTLTGYIPEIGLAIDFCDSNKDISIKRYICNKKNIHYYEIKECDCTPSHAQTIRMRKFSEEGKLSEAVVESIMQEEKPNQKDKIHLSYGTVRRYIPEEVPYERTGEYIMAALEFYKKFKNKVKNYDVR